MDKIKYKYIEQIIAGSIIAFLFVVLLAVVGIIVFTFYRINVSLYHEDPALYVQALSTFGTTFLQGTILGAGGILAAIQFIPRLVIWARQNGYIKNKDGDKEPMSPSFFK